MIIPPVFVPMRPSGRPCGDGGSRSREARAAAVDSDGLRPVLRGSTTARGASNADQITSSISNRVDQGNEQDERPANVAGKRHETDETAGEAANTEPGRRLRGVAMGVAVVIRELTFIKIYKVRATLNTVYIR